MSPFDDRRSRLAAGAQGMRLFLLSTGILFGSILIGFVCIRLLAVESPQLPPLPRGLWVSTLLLLGSSATMQAARVGARRGDRGRLQVFLTATMLLGCAFLVVQAVCWVVWLEPMRASLGQAEQMFLLTAFYALTGLHALHVVGGLIALVVITAQARAGRYSPQFHPGVIYTAMYWHFLGGVWVVTYGTLLIGM
ncbi:MAG: cytochrome c oxidase subunit 3 [Planctomycetota bacterium]|jgi:cytochrome c oxidase subunit 3